MADKKQRITTKLDADSRGLKKALDEAQQGLKDTSKEAQRTQKEVSKALDPKGGNGTAVKLAQRIASDLSKQNAGKAIGAQAGKLIGDGLGREAGKIGGDYVGKLVGGIVSGKAGIALTGAGKTLGANIGKGLVVAVGGTTAAVTAAVAAVAVAAGYAFAKRFQKVAGVIAGANATTDGNTTLYQRIQATGKGKGNEGNINALANAYKHFVEILDRANQGELEAVRTLADFGWQAKDFATDKGEAFIQAIQALQRHTDKAGDAVKIFGDNSKEAMKAYEALANQPQLNLIPQSELESAKNLAEAIQNNSQAWEHFKEVLAEESGWNATTEAMGNFWSRMSEGFNNWLSEVQWGLAGLVGGGGDGMTQEEMQQARDAHKEDVRRRKAAEAEARRLARQAERDAHNKHLEELTAKLREEQARREIEQRKQRAKAEEDLDLLYMSEREKTAYELKQYRQRLVEMGYNQSTADEMMRDYAYAKYQMPQEQAAKERAWAAEQALIDRRREVAEEYYIASLTAEGKARYMREKWIRQKMQELQISYAQASQLAGRLYDRQPETPSRPQEQDQYYSDRASRRFADAKEARERARESLERARELRRQAKTAAQEGRLREAQRLRAEAKENDEQYKRSRDYAKKVRARAKKDEKVGAGKPVKGVNPANPSGAIDYTAKLDSIITGIAGLKSNTYVVK